MVYWSIGILDDLRSSLRVIGNFYLCHESYLVKVSHNRYQAHYLHIGALANAPYSHVL